MVLVFHASTIWYDNPNHFFPSLFPFSLFCWQPLPLNNDWSVSYTIRTTNPSYCKIQYLQTWNKKYKTLIKNDIIKKFIQFCGKEGNRKWAKIKYGLGLFLWIGTGMERCTTFFYLTSKLNLSHLLPPFKKKNELPHFELPWILVLLMMNHDNTTQTDTMTSVSMWNLVPFSREKKVMYPFSARSHALYAVKAVTYSRMEKHCGSCLFFFFSMYRIVID